MKQFLIILVILFVIFSCSKPQYFKTLGYEFNGPIDIDKSEDGNYFYVLNTDFSNQYNESSILIIDQQGNKVSKVTIPRLGKKIKISGKDMIVLFDKSEDQDEYKIQLYSLEDNPIQPVLQKQWGLDDGIDCLPSNVAIRKDYKYFAVNCVSGKLFLGELKPSRSESTLKLVRDYRYMRNAIYIDPNREVLFMFPTFLGKPSVGDLEEKDTIQLNLETSEIINEPNEIPDIYEQSNRTKNIRSVLMRYIFVVYNIKSESLQNPPFPYRDKDSDYVLQNEYKWIYFNLKDVNNELDPTTSSTDNSYKHYRTNFISAYENPLDSNSFYLSHRGMADKSPYANNIIKVEIKTDISDVTEFAKMKTSDFLEFSRVYGFKHEKEKALVNFPGLFNLNKINNKYYLIINHFKDLVSFGKKDFGSAITIKSIDDLDSSANFWHVESNDINNSFYQVVFNSQGRGMSCGFYGNKILLFEFNESEGIKLGWDGIQTIE